MQLTASINAFTTDDILYIENLVKYSPLSIYLDGYTHIYILYIGMCVCVNYCRIILNYLVQ